ncbi:TfoX/Sxy family DNA transformation protein [Pseudooceanicola sp.]|uniref:TfoX/Sxy family protein n=1 Tax=Pseudooceanicola sp. TaxID=1914328 RepID=UPI002610B81E|nr:TfoX/Sxy family DNA transformation protein [Pseudooceanicola sp.]MDF1855624.1 TfoX/Sxy family DNA transformation protein [Pseudooceanicola sp.]
MDDPVSTIPNLGPAAVRDFARAGITSAAQLREIGADQGYLAYLHAGGSAHFIGYYALVMGLQGRPWNDCTAEEKAALRLRFDGLKAQAKQSATAPIGIERELDALGVGRNRG